MSSPFRWQGEPPYAAKRLKERRLEGGYEAELEARRAAVMDMQAVGEQAGPRHG